MVTATDPATSEATPESEVNPPPEDSDGAPPPDSSAPESTGQEDGEQGLKDDKPAPVVDVTALLRAAQDKLAKLQAGDDQVQLSGAELRELNAERDRVESLADADAKAQKNYDDYVTTLSASFDSAASDVAAEINSVLEEAGVELTVSQSRLLGTALQEILVKGGKRADGSDRPGLRNVVEDAIIEPYAADLRADIVAQLVQSDRIPEREARAKVARLPLIAADKRQPSLITEVYQAGVRRGQAAGVGEGQIVVAQKDYDKAIDDARKEGEVGVASNGTRVPGGGGKAPPESKQPETMEEWAEHWRKQSAQSPSS